jgi:hypothetical protein
MVVCRTEPVQMERSDYVVLIADGTQIKADKDLFQYAYKYPYFLDFYCLTLMCLGRSHTSKEFPNLYQLFQEELASTFMATDLTFSNVRSII